jgi:hypothetical protein
MEDVYSLHTLFFKTVCVCYICNVFEILMFFNWSVGTLWSRTHGFMGLLSDPSFKSPF